MYMHPLVCQRLQHEWWMCFTCYSEESLNPPNPPAAGHPPGVFVHCGAADAMLTAHWTDRNGLLKHTQSIADTVFSISLPFSAPAKRKETAESMCKKGRITLSVKENLTLFMGDWAQHKDPADMIRGIYVCSHTVPAARNWFLQAGTGGDCRPDRDRSLKTKRLIHKGF